VPRCGCDPSRFDPIACLRRFRSLAHWLRGPAAACLLLLAAGCANTPSGVTGPPPRELILTLTVAGVISPDNFYFLALDFSNDNSTGPLPIFGPPWGNGWGTGAITHYVRIHGNQAEVYRIQPNTNLLQSVFLGRPFDFQIPVNGSTASVRLDLDTLVLGSSSIDMVNVNYITTDQVNVDPRFTGPKLVDGFGADGTRYLTIPIRTSRVFTNHDFGAPLEPAGDVLLVPDHVPANAPNLDIVDWQIEVRIQ
jgi:hypothetical protein